MQVYRRQDSPSLSEFKAKVRQEEAAVGHQIKKYKTHYLSKAISPCDLQPFARFTKQLGVLITSHCKNIIMVAPESLYSVFEDMNLLVEDLVNKCHDLGVKFNDNLIELNKIESKAITTSQLCFVCSQQKKKTEIEHLREHLLNISDFHIDKQADLFPKNQEEDLQFFAEVNNLLTAQQGNVLRNQIQINKYQDIVLNSLNGLISAQKQILEKDNNVLPNSKWIESAKEEMQMALKECFSDKIPPWINKMLSYFIRIHMRQVVSKQREVDVQTDTSTHFDMLQLKKRILISKTKIQQFQIHKKIQQKELFLITTEKKALEQKIDYYKTEINKLLEQIDALKTENQIVKMKLQNSRMRKIYEDHNNSELEIQRDGGKEESMRDTIRTNMSIRKKHKVSSSQSKILPKIEELTRNIPKEGRTSIRLEQPPSGFQRSDRVKKTIKMLQDSSRGSETSTVHQEPTRRQTKKQIKEPTLEHKDSKESHEQLPAIQSQKERRSVKENRDHADRATECESIIKEEEGQTNLEEERLQMKRVDDQLREAIKKGILQKNGHKHYFSSTLSIPSLKKVPTKTIKHQYPSEIQTRESCVQTATASPSPLADSVMGINISKIFNQLTKSGYLVKLTEQQFKHIIKIKALEAQQQFMPKHQVNENRLKTLSRNKRQERLTATRQQWNERHFSHDRNMTMRPTIHPNQQFEKSYMVLFTNERNAFNYEASLTKNHSRGVNKMSKAQQKFSEQLFQRLSEIKVTDNEHYKFICSYLRFPFQMMQNNFEVNFLNDMKYTSFEYYLERIMGIHMKCKKKDGLCSHMTLFKKKLFADHNTTQGSL